MCPVLGGEEDPSSPSGPHKAAGSVAEPDPGVLELAPKGKLGGPGCSRVPGAAPTGQNWPQLQLRAISGAHTLDFSRVNQWWPLNPTARVLRGAGSHPRCSGEPCGRSHEAPLPATTSCPVPGAASLVRPGSLRLCTDSLTVACGRRSGRAPLHRGRKRAAPSPAEPHRAASPCAWSTLTLAPALLVPLAGVLGTPRVPARHVGASGDRQGMGEALIDCALINSPESRSCMLTKVCH